jgi:uncharacterized protein
MTLSSGLIQRLRREFALDWGGIHGAPHWARVRENGLRLGEVTGANARVVEAFAFLHDSRRRDDGHDPHHGHRAAEYARTLPASLLDLAPAELELLVAACAGHSEGAMTADITVCTCWDADRLDLGRVGIVPDPARLCTSAARDPAIIRWAHARSIRGAGA